MTAPGHYRRLLPRRALVVSLVSAALLLNSSIAGKSPPDTDLEARALQLEKKFMAPCCYTQTIELHESPDARAMRREVRQLLVQGLSDQEIADHFVARHGPRILAVPPPRGFNRLLYWMPYLVTLGLLVTVSLTLWIWYRRGRRQKRPDTAHA